MLKVLSFLISAVLLVSVVGCANTTPHRKPYVGYTGDVHLSETAVFVSADVKGQKYRQDGIISPIQAIDGQKISCHWNNGCPPWARVTPGDHEFAIQFSTNYRYSTFSGALLKVKVPNMKPRHVYMTRYTTYGDRVEVHIEDLGEKSDFKLISHYFSPASFIAEHAARMEYYPVEF